MNKARVIIGLTAAAALLLLKKPAMTGFYQDESQLDDIGPDADQAGNVTAGDQESNLVFDAAEDVMSIFSEWPSGSGPYQQMILDGANYYGVPVQILAWLLWKESRYNQAIISGAKRSSVGALGIAQFMPATAAQELGSADAALNPSAAIPGAARYLKKLYDQTGTWAQALAAYNWGIGNVLRKGLDNAPAETQDYYSTILAKANSGGGVYA